MLVLSFLWNFFKVTRVKYLAVLFVMTIVTSASMVELIWCCNRKYRLEIVTENACGELPDVTSRPPSCGPLVWDRIKLFLNSFLNISEEHLKYKKLQHKSLINNRLIFCFRFQLFNVFIEYFGHVNVIRSWGNDQMLFLKSPSWEFKLSYSTDTYILLWLYQLFI